MYNKAIETKSSRPGNDYLLDALQLDCIEQSAALRATLKENGFRVIHDDFLTFTPRAHYKAIIMNPPFSEGARHLLHALHIMERGGEVRCILNAETIRNPCTNERKELAALLAKYNARITYKQGAFTHAARKTAVEVALVFVTIPPAPPVSRIRLELNAETTQRYQAAPELAALVNNDPLTAAVERYNAAADGLARLYEEYDGISSLFTLPKKQGDSSAPAPCVSLTKSYNNALCDLRAIYWEQLFDLPQIRDAMTQTMQNDYHKRLNDLRHYDFTPYNILTVREEISRNIVSNIESEIIRLFDDWTSTHYADYSKNIHYYNGWCTNSAYKVNKRVIFRCNAYSVYSDDFCPTFTEDEIANIEKTLHFLDTNGTAYNGDDLRATLKAAEASGQTTKIKLHYFTATFYKKRHLSHRVYQRRCAEILQHLRIPEKRLAASVLRQKDLSRHEHGRSRRRGQLRGRDLLQRHDGTASGPHHRNTYAACRPQPRLPTVTRFWPRSSAGQIRSNYHEEVYSIRHHHRRAGGVLRCRMPCHHVERSPGFRLRQRPPSSVLRDFLPLRPSLV